MSIHIMNMISNRLSLRKPQKDSLEILRLVCDIAVLEKNTDLERLLKTIQSEFPHVASFDREFFSLCFALATGVGKTRLMGAFISYLYLSQNIKHFFVIAPNLTIYNKLITDFTPNTPKYVFKGIGELTQNPPLIITGDNYESGLGTRSGKLFDEDLHINIFNISKITAKDNKDSKLAKDDQKRNVPRMRRLSEYIGESYFNYLAGLDDLVVLMDESHRYRADAGVAAINDLKPILGLELTATPQVEKGGKSEPFNNVIYNYPLSFAMSDGFVKEPAVASRENFIPENYSESGLERIKLEDGIRIHENTKVELEVFSRNSGQEIVKPFMLVVAQDTTHANTLKQLMEDNDFFDGRYKGRIITVHSKSTKGNEGDDIVQQLLTVENPANPVEIVIHVNMLKEGWDVTNLYTIIPLRAANSRTLVEQSIGRGLRLPFGKRVGVPAVDRLTIVSHDRFQEIIDHANDPDSIIRAGVIIGRDIPDKEKKAVTVSSSFENIINGKISAPIEHPETTYIQIDSLPVSPEGVFEKQEDLDVAKVTFEVIRQYERLKGSHELQNPDIQKEIIEKVNKIITPAEPSLDFGDKVDVSLVVEKTTRLYREMSIDIPKIIVVPKEENICGYADFDLDVSGIRLQPVSHDILIQHLHDRNRYTLDGGISLEEEKRPEDYIVRGLINFDDICYDDHSKILYKLASQMVNHLKTYLDSDEKIINVLQYHQQILVNLVHSQMQNHFIESPTEYEVHVTKGFHTLHTGSYSSSVTEGIRDFRVALPEGQKNQIRSMLFNGFKKCLYPVQKFDSDPERRFAVILEQDKTVQKWFKPAKNDFKIHYTSKDSYEPDFVVETRTSKFLCEPKRADEMTDEIVIAKATAAALWCEHASVHARDTDKKSWHYLLIPHDQISEQKTLSGLAASYTYS